MFTALLKTFCLCLMCNNQLCVIEYQQSYASLSQHELFPRALRQHFLRGIINLVLRAFLGYPWLPQICSKNATVRRTLTNILPRTRGVRLNVLRAPPCSFVSARRENIENQRSERRIVETMGGWPAEMRCCCCKPFSHRIKKSRIGSKIFIIIFSFSFLFVYQVSFSLIAMLLAFSVAHFIYLKKLEHM